MPTRGPTACAAPGCPNTTPCAVHPPRRWAAGQPGRRMPPGWTKTRARILRRDPGCRIAGPRCRMVATRSPHPMVFDGSDRGDDAVAIGSISTLPS